MALLSAFAEMGFKFRMDLPEEAMDVTSLIFRNSVPSKEDDVSNTHCNQIICSPFLSCI